MNDLPRRISVPTASPLADPFPAAGLPVLKPRPWCALLVGLSLLPATLSLLGWPLSLGGTGLAGQAVLAAVAATLAALAAGLALVQHRLTRDGALPLVAAGLGAVALVRAAEVVVAAAQAAPPWSAVSDGTSAAWSIARAAAGGLPLVVAAFAGAASRTGSDRGAGGVPRSTFIAAVVLTGLAALVAVVRFSGLQDPGYLLTRGGLGASPLDIAVLLVALPLAVRALTGLGDPRITALTHALRLSAIPLAAGQVHVVLGGLPDGGYGAARALDLLQLALPLAGLMVQHVGAYAEKEGLATSLAGLSTEVEQRSLELQAAQARLSAANEFAEALNQPDMLTTYRSALHCLAQRLRTPFAALFAASEEGPPACRAAVGSDLRLLDAWEFSGAGLPAAVLRDGHTQSLQGPFDSSQLRVGAGLGELRLQSIIGWPVSFQGRCLGVIVTAHVIPPTFEQRSLVASTLEQLGVRISSAAAEEQRQRLIEDLERQSTALEAARCAADRASRVKSQILANVSHELRTPMNSIMGFTQRLLSRLGPTLEELDADALRAVERNSRQLLALISDLLDVSRVEAGRVQLILAEVDPCAVAREVVQELGPLAEARALTLTLARAPERLRLRADRARLRQVVTNLVSNAIKYTEHGHVTVSVAEQDDSTLGPAVEIAVEDTGIGIRDEDLPRLFQPFTQLDSSPARRVGGTGLGLTIAASLARLHGGRIDVQSTTGQGSRFAVVLPATCLSSAQAAAAATQAQVPGAAGSEHQKATDDQVPSEPVLA